MPITPPIDIVDRLRMIAGLSPNITAEDAAVLMEAADLIQRMRDHKRKQQHDVDRR